MDANLGDNNSLKEIFNVFNISENTFFNIKMTQQINNLKESLKLNSIPNNNDINTLNNEINNIIREIKFSEDKNNLQVLPQFYTKLQNLKEIDKGNSLYALRVKRIIEEYNSEKSISLSYIKNKYKVLFGKDISLMTVSRILRFHLGLHYRKTIVKNPKLLKNNYILMSYGFIIGIIKAITSKLRLVYIDECGFQLENSNLRMWRKNGEEITGGGQTNLKNRINLILAIDQKEILLGHYYKNNTISSTEFLEFMKDLKSTITQQKIGKTVFILDNATYHCSKEIRKFAKKEKLKILFNVPYKSNFNAIELCFHLIKNRLYKEINTNIDLLANKISFLINDDEINKNIKKLYLKTLINYKDFYENNKEKIKNLRENNKFLQKKRKIKKKKINEK